MEEKLNFLILLLTGITDFLLMIKYIEIFLNEKYKHKHYIKRKMVLLTLLLSLYVLNYFIEDSYITKFDIIGFYLIIYFIYVFFELDGQTWRKLLVIISEPIILGLLIAVLVIAIKGSVLGCGLLNSSQEGMIYYFAAFLLYIILCIIEIFYKNKFFEYRNPYVRPILAIIFCNLVLMIILIKYYVNGIFNKKSIDNVIGFIFLYEMIVTILIILFFYRIGSQLQKEHELELQLKLSKITKEYEVHIHESSKMLKALRHDLKNHFIVLAGYLDSENIIEAKKYLEQVKGKMMQTENIVYVDNIALSALLTEKSNRCKNKGIYFYTEFNRDAKLTIPDVDLCTIMGNLLDNAIEAAEQVEKENKEIGIVIKVKEKIIQIVCHNDYKIEPKIEKGKFKSLKKEKNNHGMGLKNIEVIVDKYDGIMKFNYEDNLFCIEIILKQIL